MILLTDGNTELGTDEETQESIEEKEEALEEAREKGYQIYTICLNQNNGANSDEMKQIASATGGQFREVTKAEDLKDVFDLYYQMIFSTQSIKMVEEPIPDSGVQDSNSCKTTFRAKASATLETKTFGFGSMNHSFIFPRTASGKFSAITTNIPNP